MKRKSLLSRILILLASSTWLPSHVAAEMPSALQEYRGCMVTPNSGEQGATLPVVIVIEPELVPLNLMSSQVLSALPQAMTIAFQPGGVLARPLHASMGSNRQLILTSSLTIDPLAPIGPQDMALSINPISPHLLSPIRVFCPRAFTIKASQTNEAWPDIEIEPEILPLGLMSLGESTIGRLSVHNRGDGPLFLSLSSHNLPGVVVLQGDDFYYDPANRSTPYQPSRQVVLAPGWTSFFDVFVDPLMPGKIDGSLLVHSNDPRKPQVRIPVTGLVLPVDAPRQDHKITITPTSAGLWKVRADGTAERDPNGAFLYWGLHMSKVNVHSDGILRIEIEARDTIGQHLVTLGVRGASSESGAWLNAPMNRLLSRFSYSQLRQGVFLSRPGNPARGVLLLHTDALVNVIPSYRIVATCTAGLRAEHDLEMNGINLPGPHTLTLTMGEAKLWVVTGSGIVAWAPGCTQINGDNITVNSRCRVEGVVNLLRIEFHAADSILPHTVRLTATTPNILGAGPGGYWLNLNNFANLAKTLGDDVLKAGAFIAQAGNPARGMLLIHMDRIPAAPGSIQFTVTATDGLLTRQRTITLSQQGP